MSPIIRCGWTGPVLLIPLLSFACGRPDRLPGSHDAAGAEPTLVQRSVSSGPIALWKGEGTANDSIGSLHGNPVEPVGYVAGTAGGQAFQLSGGSGHVVVAGAGFPELPRFTVDFWLKPDTTINRDLAIARIVWTKGPLSNWIGFENQTGRLEVRLPGGSSMFTTQELWNAGQWYRVTLSYDGETYVLYVDGAQAAAAANPTSLMVNNNQMIIGYPTNGFAGAVDEVAIYDYPNTCLGKPSGTACNDGSACTDQDQCNGAGVCVGTAKPEESSCGGTTMCDAKVCRQGVCQLSTVTPPPQCVLSATGACIIPKAGAAFDAVFTYRNTSTFNVPVPVGPQNGFNTNNDDLGQPRLFSGGDHGFVVPSTGAALTWKFLGGSLVADRGGATPTPQCALQQGERGDEVWLLAAKVPVSIDPDLAASLAVMDTDSVGSPKLTPGQTDVALDVTATGAAALSVPLWTPPGRNGVKPDLALGYSSQNNSFGPFGVGWSLSGTSQIRRCPKTKLQDDDSAPVDFDGADQRFCLDGRRLVQVAGTDEYRTEEDIFAKINRKSGPSGSYWEVRYRNRQIFRYGYSSASRLEGPRKIFVETTPPQTPITRSDPVVMAWAVDQVADRYGNYMTYRYGKSSQEYGAFEQSRVPVHTIWLEAIEYGGNSLTSRPHDRRVALTHVGFRRFMPKWVSGFGIGNPLLCFGISMEGPGPDTTADLPATATMPARKLLRSYSLVYDLSPSTGRHVLETIHECDAKGVCKRPTTFDWSPGSDVYEAQDVRADIGNGQVHLVGGVAEPFVENYHAINVGDFDGDGLDDVMFRKNVTPDRGSQRKGEADNLQRDNWQIKLDLLGNSALTDLPSAPPTDAELSASAAVPDRGFFGKWQVPILLDLDRDGKTDIIAPKGQTSAGRAHWRIFRSQSTASQASFSLMEQDADSNGTLSTGPNGEFVELRALPSTGDAKHPVNIYVGDLDGDGLPEVIRSQEGATRARWGVRRNLGSSSLSPYIVGDTSLFVGENRPAFTVDLDGDGKVELIYTPTNADGTFGSSAKMRALSLTSAGQLVHRPLDWFVTNAIADQINTQNWWADINGDGLADSLSVPKAGDVLPRIVINTGTTRDWMTSPLGPFPTDPAPVGQKDVIGPKYVNDDTSIPRESGVRFWDYDGDGATDLILADSQHGRTTTGYRTHGMVVWLARDNCTFDGCTLEWVKKIPQGNAPGGTTLQDLSAGPSGWYDASSPVEGQKHAGFRTGQLLDANGDGLMDYVTAHGGGLRVYLRKGVPADLLQSFENGNGEQVSITYESAGLRGSAYYTKSTIAADCQFPKSCSARGKWVVVKHLTDNGKKRLGPTDTSWRNETTYKYEGAVTDLRGEGFLGFRKRTITDGRTGATVAIEYGIDTVHEGIHPLAGRPINVNTTYTVGDRELLVGGDRAWDIQRSPEAPAGVRIYAVRLAATMNATVQRTGGNHVPTTATGTFHAYGDYFNETEFKFNRFLITTGIDRVDTYTRTTTYRAKNFNDWILDPIFMVTEKDKVDGVESALPRVTEFFTHPDTGDVMFATRHADDDHPSKREMAYVRNEEGFLYYVSVMGLDERAVHITPDASGMFPWKIRNAAGHITQQFYHPGYGVLALAIDPNDVLTTFSYDRFLRPKEVGSVPDGSESLVYEHIGGDLEAMRVTSRSTRGGGRRTTFDRLMRPIVQGSIENRNGAEGWVDNFLDYHQEGWLKSVSKGTGPDADPKMRYVYDGAGRVTDIFDFENMHTTRTYDGRKVTTIDPSGRETRVTTDFAGRVEKTEIKSGLGSNDFILTEFTYWPFDLTKGVKVAGWERESYAYDLNGRLKTRTSLDTGVTQFAYNKHDEVVWTKDANNVAVKLDRDTLGRVYRRLNENTSEVSSVLWDEAPNGIGQVYTSTSFDGTTTQNTFNALGLLETAETATAAQSRFKTTYGYDIEGRLNQITYPPVGGTSLAVGYEYDAISGEMKRLYEVKPGSPSLWTAVTRDRDGAITNELLGSQITTVYDRSDQRGLLKGITTGTNGAIQKLEYQYWENGALRSRKDANIGAGITESFWYHPSGQLKDWTVGSSGTATYNYSSVFQEIESRTSSGMSLPNASFTFQGSSGSTASGIATSSLGGASFTYDNAGNQTAGGSYTAITPTAFDLPKQIQTSTETATFKYDAFDQRSVKVSSLGTTAYHAGLYERRTEPGGVVHVMHVAAERPVADVVWVEGDQPRILYLHHDNLGSLETITDAAGAILEHRKYDPFGRRVNRADLITSAGGMTQAPRSGFTGHEEDYELGLVNMRGRIYDPKTMRFLSVDPIVSNPLSGMSYSSFAYVGNDPLNFVDPSGFQGCKPTEGMGCPSPAVPGDAEGWGNALRSVGKAISHAAESTVDFFQSLGPSSAPRSDDSGTQATAVGFIPSGAQLEALHAALKARGRWINRLGQQCIGSQCYRVDQWGRGGGYSVIDFPDLHVDISTSIPYLYTGLVETLFPTSPEELALYAVSGPLNKVLGRVGAKVGVKAARGALPAARQVAAQWGASTYRHGGLMNGLEHIMYRHGPNSGFSNVSRFAAGTRGKDVVGLVDDALRYGRVTPTGPGAYTIEHGVGRVIGTDIAGNAASSLRVHVRDGIIQTAFPF